MDKNIPIYFDSVIVDSSEAMQLNAEEKMHELKVRVFTKGKNRNGSYITEAVANQLIESAVSTTVPVVGFFDSESKTWAGHTGPAIANGYGYCKEFLGWQEFTDTDGINREYAIFSVVLFSDYFDETKYILGANQSMELDVSSITGDWANFDGEDYYVYNTAKMLGFCVIGSHEPCFSVSAFFEKDNNKENFYNKISSLLFELSQQVEETKNLKGGENVMNDELNISVENQQIDNSNIVVENTQTEPETVEHTENYCSTIEGVDCSIATNGITNTIVDSNIVSSNTITLSDYNVVIESNDQQLGINTIELTQENFDAQRNDFENQIAEYEKKITELNNQIQVLTEKINTYEIAEQARKNEEKVKLIESYQSLLSEDEINEVRANATNFSYEEVDSQLALKYSHKKLAQKDEFNYIPVVKENHDEFAELMAKYKKN